MLHAVMQNQMLFVAQHTIANDMLSSNGLAHENISVSPRPGRGARIIISLLFLRQAELRKYPHLVHPQLRSRAVLTLGSVVRTENCVKIRLEKGAYIINIRLA